MNYVEEYNIPDILFTRTYKYNEMSNILMRLSKYKTQTHKSV